MASRIKGITIEIDGNTTKLQDSLKDVDKSLSTTKSNLKDVERLLKFDPSNTTLLAQQQKYLQEIIDKTRDRLKTLNEFMEQHGDSLPADEYEALQREIAATESQLTYYQDKVQGAGEASEDAGDDIEEMGDNAKKSGDDAASGGEGWTVFKQILADLAREAIQKCIEGLKQLGRAMVDAVGDSAAFADEVLTLSNQTGLTTDTIQEMMYASELMDVSVETVQKSMVKLTNQMQAARDGSAAAAGAFEQLHLDIYNTDGSLRSVDEVFYEAIDALGKIENQTERDATAYDLFGRSAEELNSLVAIGSDGMQAYADEAHEVGAVMGGEALSSLGAVDDAMQRVNQATLVVQRSFALALAPAVSAVGEALAEMSGSTDWNDIFADLGDAIADILPDLVSMAQTILPAVASLLRIIMPIIADIISRLPLLQPLIDEVFVILQKLTPIIIQLVSDLLPPLVDILVAILPILEPILDILGPLLEMIGPLLGTILSALSVALKYLVMALTGALTPAIEKLREVTQKVVPVLQGWSNTVQNVFKNIKVTTQDMATAAKNINDGIKNAFVNTWNAIKNTATTVWNAIKNAIMNPINAAVSGVKSAVNGLKSMFSGLRLQLPHIKLPHFSISGSLSLNPPRVPRLTVSWYQRAMDEGIILNSPQIFGMMNGHLLGGGESGAEAVVGVQSLRNMIRDAVGNTNNVNVVVYGAPGQDVRELANIIEDKINANILRRKAAF